MLIFLQQKYSEERRARASQEQLSADHAAIKGQLSVLLQQQQLPHHMQGLPLSFYAVR